MVGRDIKLASYNTHTYQKQINILCTVRAGRR